MQTLCALILKLIGWKIIGTLPDDKKIIFIMAPHTSNWDLFFGLLGRFAKGVQVNFLAKDKLFFFPLGYLLRVLGGIPVNRSVQGNRVEETANLYRQSHQLKLALTPEGTRGPVTRWKEGFYHIAYQAGICIVMIGLDYQAKEIRISEPLWPSGQIEQDFPKVVDFYRTMHGRFPKEIPDYRPKGD